MPVSPNSFRTRTRTTRRRFLVVAGIVGAAAVVACGGSTAAVPTKSSASLAAPASGGGSAPPTATSGSTSAAASSGATVTLSDDNKFTPATLTVAAGTTVTFLNSSTMIHSVTDDPSKAVNKANAQLPSGVQPWDSGLLQPSQKWTHTFAVAGTYKYFCVPHETLGMLGTITVQ